MLLALAWLLPILQHLSPNASVLLGSSGLCLVAWELNRPGFILPGTAGLLCVLGALAALSPFPVQAWALCLLLLCIAVFAANLLWKLPVAVLAGFSLLLAVAFRFLLASSSPARVGLPIAALCGVGLGGLASGLSRIAVRARRAKQVN